MTETSASSFSITILHQITDPLDDNIDVNVTTASGERYFATFFTVQNIRTLMNRYRDTGECNGGTYLWSSAMIIVETLTVDVIYATVRDLMHSGEFEHAFENITAEQGASC